MGNCATKLAHFEIKAHLGSGGMGDGYHRQEARPGCRHQAAFGNFFKNEARISTEKLLVVRCANVIYPV
jgi:hypothetical protein